MRKFVLFGILALSTTAVNAQVYVQGHVRSDGTYVPGHYRSAPNDSRTDNWSSNPNINPYTGEQGRVDPYQTTYPRSSGYYNTPSRSYQPPLPHSTQERMRQNFPLTCKYSTIC